MASRRLPYSVYELVGDDGSVLYVGLSRDPWSRLDKHKALRRIQEPYSLRTVSGHRTKAAAAKAEAKRIGALSPKYNSLHRKDDGRPATGSRKMWDKALAKKMLLDGASTAATAAAVGVDRVTICVNFNEIIHRRSGLIP